MMLRHQEGIPKRYFQVQRFSASPVSRWCISSSQEQFSIPSSLIGAARVIFCRAWVPACTPAAQNPSQKTAAKSGPALEPGWTRTELCLGNGAAKPGAGATTSLAAAPRLCSQTFPPPAAQTGSEVGTATAQGKAEPRGQRCPSVGSVARPRCWKSVFLQTQRRRARSPCSSWACLGLILQGGEQDRSWPAEPDINTLMIE